MVTSKFIKKLSVTILSLLIGVAILLPLFSINAYAIDKPRVTLSSKRGVAAVCSSVNTKAKEYSSGLKKFLSFDASTYVLTIDMVGYNALSSSDKQDLMNFTLSTISNSDIPRKDRIKMYNFVAEQDEAVSSLVRQLSEDVNPDFATAYSWFKPFSGGISTLLGFLSLVIFTLIGLMMIFDLSYLTIPFFKVWLDKSSGEQPKGISREAFTAAQTAEKDNKEYKSAVGIYLKLKIKQLVLLGICLLYLVGGKIYTLVSILIDTLIGVVGD